MLAQGTDWLSRRREDLSPTEQSYIEASLTLSQRAKKEKEAARQAEIRDAQALVAANRRLFAVREIIKGFAALVARHRGEVSAQVTVAEPLSDANLGEIKNTLNAVTGKDVRVDVKVDPSIIGGLVVKLGSRMVDSSLRTKLNALKHAMKEVG